MKSDWKLKAKEALVNYNYMKKSTACIKKQLEGRDEPELEDRLKRITADVKSIEMALSFLPEDQYEVLDEFFMSGKDGYIDRLCERFICGKSAVYRLKNDALKAFYMYMFGSID